MNGYLHAIFGAGTVFAFLVASNLVLNNALDFGDDEAFVGGIALTVLAVFVYRRFLVGKRSTRQ